MEKGIYMADIVNLIIKHSDVNGYISKNKLQELIVNFEETVCVDFQNRIYSYDKEKEVERTRILQGNKILLNVNTKKDIIGNIIKYQRDIKIRGHNSSYRLFIGRQLKKLNLNDIDIDEVKLQVYMIGGISKTTTKKGGKDIGEYTDIPESEFIYGLKELTELLKVTRPTLNRWEKGGLYMKCEYLARININGKIFYPFNNNILRYYNIEYIKLQLSKL